MQQNLPLESLPNGSKLNSRLLPCIIFLIRFIFLKKHPFWLFSNLCPNHQPPCFGHSKGNLLLWRDKTILPQQFWKALQPLKSKLSDCKICAKKMCKKEINKTCKTRNVLFNCDKYIQFVLVFPVSCS